MKAQLSHGAAAIAEFGVVDNNLTVGDVPIPLLAERVGGTPFFAYSRDLISKRITTLREMLPDGTHVSYAIKANPMPAVVQHIAGLIDGFDVASGRELKVALDTPVSASRISFAGPAKRSGELSQAIAAGVLLNVESATELRSIATAGERLGVTPRVAVRVNPDFEVKASGIRMGGGSKVFGIDAEQVPDVLREISELDLGFEGFHVFTGSQILNLDALVEIQRRTVELAIRLSDHAPDRVQVLNIGGGLGVPYFPGEEPLDLPAICDNLAELTVTVSQALPDARLVLELGRYLVAEAGIYVCRVVDRKLSRGKAFLVTDGGMHHHLIASGNLGQIVRRNFPVAIGNRMEEKNADTAVEVTGCLCTPFDVLARDVFLPAAEIGDFIVIFQSGAYGPTTSPTMFLSHPAPVEVLV